MTGMCCDQYHQIQHGWNVLKQNRQFQHLNNKKKKSTNVTIHLRAEEEEED
jgi:hypothetical protein